MKEWKHTVCEISSSVKCGDCDKDDNIISAEDLFRLNISIII